MIRPVRGLQVIVEAEILRLKEVAKRTATGAAFGIVALIFFVDVLICAHLAVAISLVPAVGALYATSIVLAGDLVVLFALALLALSSRPGTIERQAY